MLSDIEQKEQKKFPFPRKKNVNFLFSETKFYFSPWERFVWNNPGSIYLPKINNTNTKTRCENMFKVNNKYNRTMPILRLLKEITHQASTFSQDLRLFFHLCDGTWAWWQLDFWYASRNTPYFL